MSSLPALFISHGSPMLALENAPTSHFLRGLSAQFPRPAAIVIASAHWETPSPALTGAKQLSTIHDFHGFPAALYDLRYPAPGNPALASRIQGMFQSSGVESTLDPTRGLDHGAWNPLLLMYPQADIPVVALSVQPQRDAALHYRIGQLLEPLRHENILVIGTGNLTHNLQEAFRGHHPSTPGWVSGFAGWVEGRVAESDTESLLNWQQKAPHALQNHPSPEHFLPFSPRWAQAAPR
jgi:4,5-DOPA dioxygenase extradiol